MFDWSKFFSVSANGIPLIFVVMGLVTFLGKMGVKGKWLLISSLLIGLLIGTGFQLSQVVPVNYAGWFSVLIFGLALGLVASGVYETGKAIAEKTKEKDSNQVE